MRHIEKKFQPKTASHIFRLHEAFTEQTIFDRSDVMEVNLEVYTMSKLQKREKIVRIEKDRNITLIGMPASGKSTVGVLLAKRLGYSFVDVDIMIQEKEKRLLKEIIAQKGMEGFLAVENRINAELEVKRSVIAPGGSVIYGKEAMEHLKEISTVVYLKMSCQELKKRLRNLMDRGVVLKDGMNLSGLYHERLPYYEKYADITIDETGKTAGEIVDELRAMINSPNPL